MILAVALVLSVGLLVNEAVKRDWLSIAHWNKLTGKVTEGKELTEKIASTVLTKVNSGQDKVAVNPTEQKLPTVNVENDKVTKLNDQGVKLILSQKYWQGMFLFKQAIDIDENRIEPHLNMAIALKEVGLIRPAARYFSQAESIDDEHPVLLQNYAIILDEGYMDNPDGELGGQTTIKEKMKTQRKLDSESILRLWGLDVKW